MGSQKVRKFRQNRPENIQREQASTRKEHARRGKAKPFNNHRSDESDGEESEHEYNFDQ